MNTEPSSAPAPQWAIVELMGHTRTGGLVTKDNQYGTALLRVDVPAPEGEKFVTQLVNPASIYRLTFCDEALARAAARSNQAAPISKWELQQALPPPSPETHATIPGLDDIGETPDPTPY